MELWKSINIWQRKSENTLICFRCLEQLTTGLFAVQSSDFFHQPITNDQIYASDSLFLELLMDESPPDRLKFFKSLEEAINNHLTEFDS